MKIPKNDFDVYGYEYYGYDINEASTNGIEFAPYLS